MASTFRGIIDFFGDLGIYDVVLPFLLVFTIMFAILDKTKILGIDKWEGQEYSKKNLNAIVAFVVAFLVIASTRLVATINEAMANIVILLLLSFGFLLLIGSFYREGEEVYLSGPMRYFFISIMLIGIVLIFLYAIKTSSGQPWLEWFWRYLKRYWRREWVASIGFVIFVIVAMVFVTWDRKPKHGGHHGGNRGGHQGNNH
jgi:hypothetical protein